MTNAGGVKVWERGYTTKQQSPLPRSQCSVYLPQIGNTLCCSHWHNCALMTDSCPGVELQLKQLWSRCWDTSLSGIHILQTDIVHVCTVYGSAVFLARIVTRIVTWHVDGRSSRDKGCCSLVPRRTKHLGMRLRC